MLSINLKIPEEEKFLINILFNKKEVAKKEINFDNINYELLVKIVSSHQMLPSLYINLKNKGFINLIPLELKIYLQEIYTINKKRNQVLLNEVKEISKNLIYNNINHVFIKGASYLFNNIYDDIGERMIGDIDILVSKEDYERSIDLVKKFDYKEISKYVFFNKLHYPRLKNKNKLFSIEIHKYLISKKNKKLIDINSILKNKKINKISTMKPKDELLYNIYSFQINDFGSYYEYYNYKNLYDSFKLIAKNQINLKNEEINIYLKKYLIFTIILGINNEKIKLEFTDKLFIYRCYFKRKYITLNNLNIKFLKSINKLKIIPIQIKEMICNANYREYLIIKLGLNNNFKTK